MAEEASIDQNTDETIVDENIQITADDLISDEDPYSVIPDKFKNEDGTVNSDALIKSYNHLEKSKRVADIPEDYSLESEEFSNVEWDEEKIGELKKEAKEAGFNQGQFEFMMTKYKQTLDNMFVSADQVKEQMIEQWGDDMQTNLHSVAATLNTFGATEEIRQAVAGNIPVMNLLIEISKELQEDSSLPPTGGSGALTEDDIDSIMSEPDYYRDKEKQKVVDQWFNKNYGSK